MHRSYGLQGSLKRRYKHPSLLPSMGTTRQKSSCRNGLQNGPRLLSRVKAGTHSPSPTGSHTAAYTPKQGPSLLRSQCGFVLPAKSLLFHRAFIYIHFPVLCGPSLSAEEKKSAKMPPQLCPQPFLIAFFNFAHKWPTFAFTDESEYTLGSAQRIAHNGSHAETGAASDEGAITTLGAFHTFRKPCVARYQNGKLCRFWVLAGCTPEGRRKPAGQRCAYARRCSAAPRPRRAA